MQIQSISKNLCRQLGFFGELTFQQREVLISYIPEALKTTQTTLNLCVSIPKTFNFLQSHHHAIFLYRLARRLFEEGGYTDLCEKLFLLNRMVNGVDLYYKISMPEHFLLGHGLATVFSRAEYGNYFVIFQNVTIGTQDGMYPKIGENVVIYPNSVVVGSCVIGDNSVVGAGTILINKSIPENSVVFQQNGVLTIKENDRNDSAC